MSVAETLKRFWSCQGIKLRPGISENEIGQFEAKYNVQLPHDLREYFATVNGFDASVHWTTDENCISFWGLDELKPLNEYWTSPVEDADSYFVFADYSLAAHVYAIRLRRGLEEENTIVAVYDRRPITVANSFHEFVQCYLADNESALFPEAR